jgi:hypothetical protein
MCFIHVMFYHHCYTTPATEIRNLRMYQCGNWKYMYCLLLYSTRSLIVVFCSLFAAPVVIAAGLSLLSVASCLYSELTRSCVIIRGIQWLPISTCFHCRVYVDYAMKRAVNVHHWNTNVIKCFHFCRTYSIFVAKLTSTFSYETNTK